MQHSNTAIQEFKIQILDERGGSKDIWRLYNPTQIEDSWNRGQVKVKALTSGIDYWIIFQAIKGAGEDGYAAIDNLDFVQDEECVTLPASAEPVECGPGHIECGDHTCIGLVSVCYEHNCL